MTRCTAFWSNPELVKVIDSHGQPHMFTVHPVHDCTNPKEDHTDRHKCTCGQTIDNDNFPF